MTAMKAGSLKPLLTDQQSTAPLMDFMSPLSTVNLKSLCDEFCEWQKIHKEVVAANTALHAQVAVLSRQHQLARTAEQEAKEESAELKGLVEKWQGLMSRQCDMEEETTFLKQQIADLKSASLQQAEQHKRQMDGLLAELEAARLMHTAEVERLREEAVQQGKREKALLEKSVQEKAAEVRQLQKHLLDLEREKHAELVKVRFEYDGKLLKLQKQLAKGQANASSGVGHEIFRKKLEHSRAESSREISQLKRRIVELEQQQQSVAGRRRH